jgi:Nuclease-related domain
MGTDLPAKGQRAAGQYARSVANELSVRLLAAIAFCLLMLFATVFVFGLRGPVAVAVELVAIGLMVVANRLLSPQIDRWLQGARGEQSVGAVLSGLSADGWQAIHDVSLGRGNVDHVLVGPGGIFAIETKSQKGRVSVDRINSRMLKQAYAEKKLLERITGMEVQPLLVFSDAWLIGRVPARREGVTVLPARMLAWYVSRRRPAMTVEEAQALHARLAVAVGQPVVIALDR